MTRLPLALPSPRSLRACGSGCSACPTEAKAAAREEISGAGAAGGSGGRSGGAGAGSCGAGGSAAGSVPAWEGGDTVVDLRAVDHRMRKRGAINRGLAE